MLISSVNDNDGNSHNNNNCSTNNSNMSAKRVHLTQQHWWLCGKHLQSSVRQTFPSNNSGPKWSCDCRCLVNLFTKQLICFLVSLITCWMLQPPRPSAGCVTQKYCPPFFPLLHTEELLFQGGFYNWSWWFVVKGARWGGSGSSSVTTS